MMKPEVVSIPYDTQRHSEVIEAVRQRYRLSHRYMSKRHEQWSDMENRSMAYVNFTANDITRKQLRKEGKPQFVTIDVPYSFALMLTAHTYWSSVFLSRNPVLQYAGLRGETQTQEQAVEAIMQYQLDAGRMMVPLFLWMMDAGKYGLGVLGNSWVDEKKYVSQVIEVERSFAGLKLPGKSKKRQTIEIAGYSGNRSFNVRPQDFFPDPRVPVSRLQEGEFCGRIVEVGWNTILRREQQGWYFNIKELRDKLIAKRAEFRDMGSSQLELPAGMDTLYTFENTDTLNETDKKKKSVFIELMEMVIEIVPREWNLGNSTYPEKWVFVIANDEVVIGCMPQGAYHGEFDFSVLEYEIEAYALSKRSMLELVDPLNQVLTWLFNSHMYNVRKALNDQLIVDPSRVTMKDFTDPSAGRLVRLKPEAYGTDPKLAYSQIKVEDITRANLADAQFVMELMQRVPGVTENVMGMVNQGGRKTATEVRTSSTFGINRLKTNAEYMSAMGFSPWALRLLKNTQQRYDAQKLFRIAGAALSDASQILVDPSTIAGEFQYVPVDGTMPIDRFAQANLWKEFMVASQRIPVLANQIDWLKLMGYVAQLSGIKNLDQFKLQVNVVPDEMAQNQAQQGNIVPLGGQGGNRTGSAGGSPSQFTSVPGAGTVSGVGRTG